MVASRVPVMRGRTARGRVADGPAPADESVVSLRHVTKEFYTVTAVDRLDLELGAGKMLALLGPSGCGKTTTLRMIAGLERPTSGEIWVGGQCFADGRHSVPPERRGLGMVFQSYALWPHMDVAGNIAYGLKRAGLDRVTIAARIDEVLKKVGMEQYGSRAVTELSGGQQQRVAVARALATRPSLLLFDEPLSNLDAVLRESMRFEIRELQLQHQITSIYVTHSQEEALAMADVVGIMDSGRLQQLGTPEELYLQPRNRFVANFVGLANVIDGVVERVEPDHVRLRLPSGETLVSSLGVLGADEVAVGERRCVALRPERIRLVLGSDPAPSPEEQTLRGRVVSRTFSGSIIDYFLDVEGAGRVRTQMFAPATGSVGETVTLAFDTQACVLLADRPDRETRAPSVPEAASSQAAGLAGRSAGEL